MIFLQCAGDYYPAAGCYGVALFWHQCLGRVLRCESNMLIICQDLRFPSKQLLFNKLISLTVFRPSVNGFNVLADRWTRLMLYLLY